MPDISTIPEKLPKPILRDLKKEIYDNIILFTLAVFGPHELKELVNNRMDEKIFHKWADDLKNKKFIEEYKRDNGMYYKITNEGEDELMTRIENDSALNRLLHRLIVTFDGLLGGSVINEKIQSK